METSQNFAGTTQMDLKDSTGVIIGGFAVYVSTDNGNNWSKKNVPTSEYIRRVDIISRDTIMLVVGTSPFVFSNLLVSHDRGANWAVINSPFRFNMKAFDFVDSKTGYATGWSPNSSNAQLFKTVDGGISWQVSYPVTS